MITIIKHLDDKFSFGKFQGQNLGEVLMYSPDYLKWVVEHVGGNHFVLMDSAVDEIKEIFPKFSIDEDFEINRQRQLDDFCGVNDTEENDWEDDWEDNRSFGWEEEPTYERYGGSYAQDEMGFSDDEIDTIFDGDPSAYWNID